VKEAREATKLRAARILKRITDQNAEGKPQPEAEQEKIKPLACRFHLRHTAVSRMRDAGVPIAKVEKIVGWSPATMVRMAARYGHFDLEELRSAIDSISRTKTQAGSPVSLPDSGLIRPN
jgi:hypothetical protein